MSSREPSKSAAEAFDRAAPDYDAWVRQALPTYEELFSVAVEVIPHASESTIRVADLGAGSGLFSERVRTAYPAARFALFDASATMLDRARERFAGTGDRFAFHQQNLEQFHGLGDYDLVISSLAIHHLEHDEKQALFFRVFESLRTGGAFVNVDQVRGETPFGDLYWSTWLSKVRASGAPESRIEASIERRKAFDRDASLGEQLGWLREAGFQADCIYKHYFVAVFLALKPA
jgi:tRNA (cmo5U34)-methyltransferase